MQTLQKTAQLPDIRLTVRRQMVGYRQRLAERIIEARLGKGWDRRTLAFHADISEKTIQRLEQAQVDQPRPSTLRKLADAMDRQVDDLRPDMETEEKNLRAQLNEMDRKLDEILEILKRPQEPPQAPPIPPDEPLPGERSSPTEPPGREDTGEAAN